ncbi:hypothetical protein [Anaerobacillus alkalilacustris]|uniref:hypothetical protein n=1 Tax=Anaerobacillus alkalilacustris TaxID=393763 RepID=UPI00147095B6|nr:hypothetical protein [Anaerobacillus alkalilacustris]
MKLINEGFQEVIEVSCLTEVTELVGACARQFPTFKNFMLSYLSTKKATQR